MKKTLLPITYWTHVMLDIRRSCYLAGKWLWMSLSDLIEISYCIGLGKWAILRLRWNKGKFFLGKSYIIFGNVELKWLTHLKNTEFWSNISVISHDPCLFSWRVHASYLCCFTSNRIILEHHFKIQNFAKEMWSKIFIAGYGFSAVAANCS